MKRSKNHRLDTHEVWFFEQKTKNEFCQLNHTLYPSPSMIINADTKCPFIRFLSDSRDSAEELSSHITEWNLEIVCLRVFTRIFLTLFMYVGRIKAKAKDYPTTSRHELSPK